MSEEHPAEAEGKIVVFGARRIRRTWVDEQWYFSVVDIIAALTDSNAPSKYWAAMKRREEETSGFQLSTICRQLRLTSSDGKSYRIGCVNTEAAFRIIQSIPSPKAEPFKRWLAQVGHERIQEIENPELAQQRMRQLYKDKLRKGSPANGAGKGGVTIGAMEYPNVYCVDPRHPAAQDEPAWGYAAAPLATLAKACAVAQAGETVILRGGVYRETLRPKNDGVTFHAMKGEKVTISGADLIEGWKREEAKGDSARVGEAAKAAEAAVWSAPLAAEPKKVLRDGQPWTDFTYDKAAKRLTATKGGAPRLHVFETLVRDQAIDPAGKKDVKIEDITTANTLKEVR